MRYLLVLAFALSSANSFAYYAQDSKEWAALKREWAKTTRENLRTQRFPRGCEFLAGMGWLGEDDYQEDLRRMPKVCADWLQRR